MSWNQPSSRVSGPRRVRARLAGVTLAESDETVLVEGNHYFPPSSIEWDRLSPAKARSVCPWKGLASYYDVEVGGERATSAAWTYRRPFPWIRKIRDHIAFWGPVQVEEVAERGRAAGAASSSKAEAA